jgi:diguanylate cyclase (GGDEF)-like protein
MRKQEAKAPTIEQEELRGISRTVAEIEWLLLILVLLYLAFGGPAVESRSAVEMALFFYAAFILAFHYLNFFSTGSRWKIAVETWAMLLFIAWVLWFTGRLASPLLNTYLLVIITCALTLGKAVTLLEMALIAACYIFLGWQSAPAELLTLGYAGRLAAQLAPMVLVAYVTTMFSADIRYGLNRAKLMSETDELTGIYNRRGFAIAADPQFAQSQRHGRPASVLMIDLDNLKTINDTLGHAAGDEAIKIVARCIAGELRLTDVAARRGGDEFIALLAETPLAGALEVASRIRRSLAEAASALPQPVSVSIGVASYPQHAKGIDSLITRADRALYAAKEGGRNRVEQFQV